MVGRTCRANQFMTMLFKGTFQIALSSFCQNDILYVSTLIIGTSQCFNLDVTCKFVKVLISFSNAMQLKMWNKILPDLKNKWVGELSFFSLLADDTGHLPFI